MRLLRAVELGGHSEAWLFTGVILRLRTIEVAVRPGENSGRTLPHTGDDPSRPWSGEAAIFPVPASEAELAEAAIVQAAESGPILAAAKR